MYNVYSIQSCIRQYKELVLCRVLKFLHKCILLLIINFSCNAEIEKAKNLTDNKNYPIEKSKNVDIIYSETAKIQVRIKAKEMKRFIKPENYIEFPEGIKLEFYNDSGNLEATLNANYAKYIQDKNIMKAENNVVLSNLKGEKLESEELIWDQNKHKIFSNSFVKITTQEEIIMGNGFESNEDFSKYKIKKIKGVININEN